MAVEVQEIMENEKSLILQQLERVQNSQAELFSLDRKKSDILNNLRNDFTQIKTEHKYSEKTIMEIQNNISDINSKIELLNNNQSEMKNDIKMSQVSIDNTNKTVNKILETMDSINTKIDQKKWRPQDYVLIICAVLSTLSAIAVAILAK